MVQAFLKSTQEITDWLDQYGITGYELIPDAKYGQVVNVNRLVELHSQNLQHIPVKFHQVSGGFYCENNQLETLEFAPKIVRGGFDCSGNQLTNLVGAPLQVEGDFFCDINQLATLEGMPKKIGGGINLNDNCLTSLEFSTEKAYGDFYCKNNRLTSLKGAPGFVGQYFDCSNNQLHSLEFCPEQVEGHFIAAQNNIQSLEFLPKKVSGQFYFIGNPQLGPVQQLHDNEEVMAIHQEFVRIKKEKSQLDSQIKKSTIELEKATHKI